MQQVFQVMIFSSTQRKYDCFPTLMTQALFWNSKRTLHIYSCKLDHRAASRVKILFVWPIHPPRPPYAVTWPIQSHTHIHADVFCWGGGLMFDLKDFNRNIFNGFDKWGTGPCRKHEHRPPKNENLMMNEAYIQWIQVIKLIQRQLITSMYEHK